MGNPYDVVEPDELVKLRRSIEKLVLQRRKDDRPEFAPLHVALHTKVQNIAIRGRLSDVLEIHELAQRKGLRLVGSRSEDENEDGETYATVWYELDKRPETRPDDLGLLEPTRDK